MKSITIGQIVSAIATITIIVKFCSSILKVFKKAEERLNTIDERLNAIDEASCKNFLVRYLRDVENGETMDDVETERAYEIYDRYINILHKNSYIHSKWEKLMEKR